MRVTVIGCAGSFPGPDSAASCYLVEAEGFSLLLDLGAGALGTLQRYHGLYEIDAICLSRLHPDHCIDLCAYWAARTYCPLDPRHRIPAYGPKDTADRMAQAYDLDLEPGMKDAFHFRTLRNGPQDIGPFRVTAAEMNHPVEAYGFRIEHDGRVLAYSGDTGVSEALVKLAAGADLFLCEASFLDKPDLPEDLHLSGRQAGEHAARAGVRRLVLTHLVPWNLPLDTLNEAEGSGFTGQIDLAHTGASYDL